MLNLYDINHNKIAPLASAKEPYVEKEFLQETLSFSYPIADIKSTLIQEEGYVRTSENEYVVKEINEDEDYLTCKCTLNLEDFNTMYPATLNFTGQTILQAFNWLCTNTTGSWTVAYCDVTAVISLDPLTNPKYSSIINTLRDMYAFEIKFDSINKKIYIYQEMGSDKGAYFLDKLNLKKLEIQRSSYDFITQMLPIGKNGAYITPVNNKVFLENYQYSNKHIYAIWQDNRYIDMNAMKQVAIKKLDQLSKPARAYKAYIIDLASMSPKYKNILSYDLGDTITLVNTKKKIKEKQRIVKLTKYLEEPEKNTVEIANRTILLEDMQVKTLDAADTISNATDVNGNLLGSSVDSVDYNKVNNVQVQTYQVVDAAITTAKIADASITGAKIALATIDTANIKDANITNAKIDRATANKLQIVTADIVDASITNAKIDRASANKLQVVTADIADGNITNAKIADATIQNAKIANLDAGKITSGTIDVARLEAGSITANEIATGTITATSGLIANGGIVNAMIADGTIASAKIASLDAGKITAGILDASVVTVKNLNADNINTGSINGQRIADGAISNTKVASTANIDGSKLNIDSVVTSINGGTTNIQSNKIQTGTQTLDAKLSNIDSTITAQGQSISTQYSQISANATAIATKVNTSDFNTYKNSNDSNVSSLTTKMNTAESSITQQAGQIATKVSQTDINNSINNIQIGGRNLYKAYNNFSYGQFGGFAGNLVRTIDSTAKSGMVMSVTCTTSGVGFYISCFPTVPGQTYTWSLCIKCSVAKSGQIGHEQGGRTTLNLTTDWKKYTYTYVADNSPFFSFTWYIGWNVGETVYFKDIKLEEGNKPTDWTPAPEDVQGQIDSATTRITNAESSITQNSNSIALKANQSSLDTTNNNISGLTSRMSTAESSLSVQAGQIATKVTQTQVDSSISNIQVGGRNLLRNTDFRFGSSYWKSNGYSSWIIETSDLPIGANSATQIVVPSSYAGIYQSRIEFISNKVYTLSMYAKGTPATLRYGCEGILESNIEMSASWTKCSYSFTGDGNFHSIVFYPLASCTLYLTNIKLEEGNKPTDWTPAPEDVQGQIDTTNSNVNGLATRISAAESSITQNASNIVLKVAKDSVISSINQSAEIITINASKLNLTGYATFTNLNTAGQTTINAGNIVTGTMVADRIKGGTLTLGGADLNTNGKFQLYDKNGVLVLDSDTVTALATQAALDAKGDKTYNVNDFSYTINANEVKIFTIALDKAYKYGQALIYSYWNSNDIGVDNASFVQIGLNFCKNSLRTTSIITPNFANSGTFSEQRMKSSELSYLGYLDVQGIDFQNRWSTGLVLIDFYIDNDQIKFTVANKTGSTVTRAMRVQSQVW